MTDFKFGNTSLQRLETCHTDIRHVMLVALELSKVDFFIAEGLRNKEKQDEYFTTGASKVGYPGSFHNELPFSLAVDVVPWVNNTAMWSHTTSHDKEAWYEMVKAIKKSAELLNVPLEWGYDLWEWDRPHWQLTTYRK